MSASTSRYKTLRFRSLLFGTMLLTACAQADIPGARNVNIPALTYADERRPGVNERPDSVIYLPLGKDVLVPQTSSGQPLPDEIIGPFELRSETLAGALQLVLAGYDIPIAFETEEATTRTITVTNLKGPINEVVPQICALADLYCSYERGVLTVKEDEIFTVSIPPIGEGSEMMTQVSAALASIVGGTPVLDTSTRTLVYRATNRSAEMAERYFQRMRNGTAMIVYEAYIWEVTLDNGNSAGINWSKIGNWSRFNVGMSIAGTVAPALGSPISIGLPTTGTNSLSTGDVLRFISSYGAVKTISQPQITVLSGSSARLRVAETENYVSSISRTTDDNGDDTVSTETSSVDTGFTLEINSRWDNATVYGDFKITLQENLGIETFDDNPDAIVQLPRTTEREVDTNVRVRPGDSVLLAGLVREADRFDKSGLGFEKPLLPVERSAISGNSELVIMLRPRVVAFVSPGDQVPSPAEVTPAFESMVSQQMEPALPLPEEPTIDVQPIETQKPETPPDAASLESEAAAAVDAPEPVKVPPKVEPKTQLKADPVVSQVDPVPLTAKEPTPPSVPQVETSTPPRATLRVTPMPAPEPEVVLTPEPVSELGVESDVSTPINASPVVPPADIDYNQPRQDSVVSAAPAKPIGVME